MTREEMLKEFRRPFHSSDVEFRIGATTPKPSAMCLAYVDARHVQERLNAVTNGKWDNDFTQPVIVQEDIKAVEATITVYSDVADQFSISHADVGSLDNVNEEQHGLKALYSDAFKRAAVHFGIAVSLYSLPTMWLNDEYLKKNKQGKLIGINADGYAVLKKKYIDWLTAEGVEKFGKPYKIPE